jgi:hypothetical protein
MTTNTKANCNSTDLCQYDSFTRARFFHGMLLTDEDLRSEQAYHRNALKRVNRYLWGSGIVCGLEVKQVTGLCIQVQPGAALDCDGNLIEVCKCISIDLSKLCKDLYPGGCIPPNKESIKKYLVIRYAELEAEPVPVQGGSDDCSSTGEGGKCQPSRYREGYCIEFRDKCPNPKPCGDEPKSGLVASLLKVNRAPYDEQAKKELADSHPGDCAGPPCPDCECHECAVGLADLNIDCSEGKVKVTCECRHYVCSPRLWQWVSCQFLDGVAEATKDLNEPMKTVGKMMDARVMLGRRVSEVWNIGRAFALASPEDKKKFRADLVYRFGPQVAKFAQDVQPPEVKKILQSYPQLQEQVIAQGRELENLKAILEELRGPQPPAGAKKK